MDADARERRTAIRLHRAVPATYGRGRAVRLAPEVYTTDVPIHLTVCANDGRPFERQGVATMVCGSVERCAELLNFRLFAYCLMPDHLHLVVSPAESRKPISEYLKRLKGFTTHEYHRMVGTYGLLQASAHDRVKRPGESIETLVRYIADNPVRAGLVRAWTDWPYTRVFVEI